MRRDEEEKIFSKIVNNNDKKPVIIIRYCSIFSGIQGQADSFFSHRKVMTCHGTNGKSYDPS